MNLSELRHDIDQIDQDIVRLLEARLDAVTEIARIKKSEGLPILDSSREAQLLTKIASLVQNPSYQKAVLADFQDLLKNSKAYQAEQLRKDKD